MASITFKEKPVKTVGELPAKGTKAKDFTLVRTDLSEAHLGDFKGKKILNIFPSIDTGICAASVRAFNAKAGSMPGVTVINISLDLPFAHKRWCGAEGLEGVVSLSAFRSKFPDDYGLRMADGPMAGLCSRVVLVLDADNKVVYSQQVPEIVQEPTYDAALAAL